MRHAVLPAPGSKVEQDALIFLGVGRHNRRRSVRQPIVHHDYIQYLVGLPADAGKRCADGLLGIEHRYHTALR